MEVVQKNTSKGIVIRFVFQDVDEYNLCMDNLTEICEGMSEHGNEHLKELIGLFKDYYDPEGRYTDGKPTVTVFENHLLTLAAQLWIIMELSLASSMKNLQILKDYNETLNKYKAVLKQTLNKQG